MSIYLENKAKLNSWLDKFNESYLVGDNIPAIHFELTECELLAVFKNILDSRCINYSRVNFSSMLGVDFNSCYNQTGINQDEVTARTSIPAVFGLNVGSKCKC